MTSTGHRGSVIAAIVSAIALPVAVTMLSAPATPPAYAASVASLASIAGPAVLGLATPDSSLVARIDTLRLAMRADAALALIEDSLPRAEASGDSALCLALEVRQGELLTSLGEARRGEAVLRSALGIATARSDSAALIASVRWLSVAVASQGRADEARDLYDRLRTLARARGDTRHEGWAEIGFGWDAIQRGAGAEALDHYRRAVDLFKSAGDSRGEAWALNGLGTAFVTTGGYDDARHAFRNAGVLGAAIPYPMVASFAANNLGDLEYQLGDPAAAVAHFEEAARINRAIGNLRESVVPSLNMATCDAELGRTGAAADSLSRLLALCRKEGYAGLEAPVRIHLAEARRLQGRTSEARSLYQSVLAPGAPSPLRNRVEAMIGLAELAGDASEAHVAYGRIASALASPEMSGQGALAVDLTNALAGGLLASGNASRAARLAAIAAANAARLGRKDLELTALALAGRSRRALGDTAGARRAFERARRVWEEQRGLAGDPEWREARGAIGKLLSTDLAALILDSGEPAAAAYASAQSFKARTLYERMTGPERSRTPPRPAIELEPLQREVLADGELLLDFFLGPTRSLVFAVRRDSCRVIALPGEEEIASPIRLYHDLVAAPPPDGDADLEAIQGAGRSLRRLLAAGAEDWIATSQRVIVVPDGAMNLVSLGDLGGVQARAGPDTSGPAEWVNVPSAAILADLRARHDRREDDGRAPRLLALFDRRSAPEPLSGARREAASLAKHYRHAVAQEVAGDDTLPLSGLALGRDVLHIASHAAADDERPWQSSLFVGRGGLRAADLAAAELPFRLAVLSSCQTSHARILSGEGVLGLSSALLSAGTECVVATLWPVDDAVTAALIESFYRELSSGRTVAGALARARHEVARDPRTAHPFYWAGFIAVGAGEVTIPLLRRVMPPSYAVAALALAVGWCFFLILASWGRAGRLTRPGSRS